MPGIVLGVGHTAGNKKADADTGNELTRQSNVVAAVRAVEKKIREILAGVAQLVGVSTHKPKGCRFGLQQRRVQEAADRCSSPSLSPPPFPSL